jgi:hypothetical protein
MHRAKSPAAALAFALIAAAAAAQTDNAAQTGTPAASATPCTDQPMNHRIDVTSAGVSCKNAHVSKKQQNSIQWTSPKGTTLSLAWDTESPFQSITCAENLCNATGLRAVPTGASFGYAPAIDGVKTKDPNVIINP